MSHLVCPRPRLFREVFVDNAPSHQEGEQVAEGSTSGRAEANEHQRQWEWKQESRENGQRDRARNGKRLQAAHCQGKTSLIK